MKQPQILFLNDLFFNYKIDPAKLKEKLNREVDGKEASFYATNNFIGYKISFRLASFKPETATMKQKLQLQRPGT
jgi:hypothetical protein